MTSPLWLRFQQHYLAYPSLDFALDISRMGFPDSFIESMQPAVDRALRAMRELESGAIANPDENRMVGHYWLRDSSLAPEPALARAIDDTLAAVVQFARDVHSGTIAPARGGIFTDLLVVGIGGSALGPQFLADALGDNRQRMAMHFLDNTDPDGFDRMLAQLSGVLASTLVVVISKSGGTKETRNGMVEVAAAYEAAGLDFAGHAVAVTGEGSALDQVAVKEKWLRRFPMWDWVGGRTSVMSAVGLVPMSLHGYDVEAFLAGARSMDELTRGEVVSDNAALLLALMWHYAGEGRGARDMVILPYKDRLQLFSKYLQQLVMESLGKSLDLDGKKVEQGLAVYGNKGSTDQHAYVQQLRDGVNNFFATFIEVRQSRRDDDEREVEPGVTSGDYLHGFLRGTRTALSENNRESITLSIPEVNEFQLGALIALYERAVGFYASLVKVNAYHQPGVEAGKKAATAILKLQSEILETLKSASGTAQQIAARLGADPEDVFHLLRHLEANRKAVVSEGAPLPGEARFFLRG